MTDVTGDGRPSTGAPADEAQESNQAADPGAFEEHAESAQAGDQRAAPPDETETAPAASPPAGGPPDAAAAGPTEVPDVPEVPPEAGAGGEGTDAPVAESTGDVGQQPAGSEQIEWQPVVDGDTIEWQPVVTYDTAGGYDETVAGEAEPQPDFEYPEGTEPETPWHPDLAAATSGASGNGATPSAETAPAGVPGQTSPGPRRPPVRREPVGDADGADGEGDAGAAGDAPDGGKRGIDSKTKRQVIILSALTVLVVAIGVVGFLLSRDAKETGEQAATPNTSVTVPSNTVPRLPEDALQTYTDELSGFSMKIAESWQLLRAPNADLRLVANLGGNDAVSVRVVPIQTPATVDNVGNLKAVTDAIVFGDKENELIQEQLVTVNGLLAYYYLYTFPFDENTEGVHAQYFVFEGNRMFVLTFQSVPVEDFPKHANIWDQVAESFTVQPRPTTTAAPDPTSTSVP